MTLFPASPFSLTAAGQVLTFTADSLVASGNYTLSFQATSGSLNATATTSVSIAPPGDFTLGIYYKDLTVRLGDSTSTEINIVFASAGSSNYTVQLAASSLPAGVTADFSPNPAPPGNRTSLKFTAATSAPTAQNAVVEIKGTRSTDGEQEFSAVRLSVVPPVGQLPFSRTEFVRTDDTSRSAVYDAVHKLIFVAEPRLSRVDVISPDSRKIVKSIPVPGARGLSLTSDHRRVLVSGSMQQVSWIDTVSLTVSERSLLPKDEPNCTCDPQFVDVPVPAVTSSGKVLFLGRTQFFGGVLVWDPVAGTIVERNDSEMYWDAIMARSADGSKVILSDNSSGGGVSVYNAATDTFPAKRAFGSYAFALAANPNGTQFAVAVSGQPIYIVDSALSVLGIAPAGGLIAGMVYSVDGRYLYVVSQPGGVPIISTVDAQTFQLVGTAPAFATNTLGVTRVPPLMIETPLAADDTGLVFGMADHGLVLDDATFYQSFPETAVAPVYGLLVEPGEGPINSSTRVRIITQAFFTVPDIWFGSQRGTNAALDGVFAEVTAPPATAPGPVNVRIFDTDGTVAVIPQGFTYGGAAVTYGSLGAAPSGGAKADLFGYGFSTDVEGQPVHVQIGGQTAAVTKCSPSAEMRLSSEVC